MHLLSRVLIGSAARRHPCRALWGAGAVLDRLEEHEENPCLYQTHRDPRQSSVPVLLVTSGCMHWEPKGSKHTQLYEDQKIIVGYSSEVSFSLT